MNEQDSDLSSMPESVLRGNIRTFMGIFHGDKPRKPAAVKAADAHIGHWRAELRRRGLKEEGEKNFS